MAIERWRPAHPLARAAAVRAAFVGGVLAVLCTASSLAASAPARARGASTSPTPISLRADPQTVARGGRTTISGAIAGASAGMVVELQGSEHGDAFRDVAHTATRSGGRFRFPALRVYDDTTYRLRALAPASPPGPVVEVTVALPPYPSAQRIAAARRYLAGRGGTAAFAVVDDRGGLHGANLHERFHSASVVKSMMLVAYLRMLAARDRPLDPASGALLYPMIHESNNDAASAVLGLEGQAALDRVARDAGMQDYERAHGWWAYTEVSAADLARFFYRMDSLVPRRFDGYARWLLANIEPSQSWGAPPVARPEFEVFFKTGWLPEAEGLINEAARLERPQIVFALAVLTRGNPSMAYGEESIAGVTARLLGRAP